MLVKPCIPAGFMELLPEEQIVFNSMLNTIKNAYERFGFTPIETPAIEFSEVLFAKAGGETEKQIYNFTRGDKEYCLHFDLTVPLARYVAEHFNDLTFPFRRYQLQKVWRAERPQRGRFREFYQCDIDVIGSTNPLIDAEIVSVINSVFIELNLGGFVVSINNRKLMSGFIASLGLKESSQDILRLIDKIEKQDRSSLSDEMVSLGATEEIAKQIFDFVEIDGTNDEIVAKLKALKNKDELFLTGLNELETVVSGIKSLGVPDKNYKIDLKIARGLDYYTGTVYETFLTEHGNFGSVCSGGRFDNLASYYTDEKLPGVGISIGLTRLFSQLKADGFFAKSQSVPSKVLITQMDSRYLEKCLEIASKLRTSGINTEVYLEEERIGKQFKYANKLGIPYVIVIGEEEFTKDIITFKDMSTGSQEQKTLEEIIDKLK